MESADNLPAYNDLYPQKSSGKSVIRIVVTIVVIIVIIIVILAMTALLIAAISGSTILVLKSAMPQTMDLNRYAKARNYSKCAIEYNNDNVCKTGFYDGIPEFGSKKNGQSAIICCVK